MATGMSSPAVREARVALPVVLQVVTRICAAPPGALRDPIHCSSGELVWRVGWTPNLTPICSRAHGCSGDAAANSVLQTFMLQLYTPNFLDDATTHVPRFLQQGLFSRKIVAGAITSFQDSCAMRRMSIIVTNWPYAGRGCLTRTKRAPTG